MKGPAVTALAWLAVLAGMVVAAGLLWGGFAALWTLLAGLVGAVGLTVTALDFQRVGRAQR